MKFINGKELVQCMADQRDPVEVVISTIRYDFLPLYTALAGLLELLDSGIDDITFEDYLLKARDAVDRIIYMMDVLKPSIERAYDAEIGETDETGRDDRLLTDEIDQKFSHLYEDFKGDCTLWRQFALLRHDLSQPLTIILGSLELIATNSDKDSRRRHIRSAIRALPKIKDHLDITTPQAMDLGDVVQRFVSTYQEGLTTKVVVDADGGCNVFGVESDYRICLHNLLTNAGKAQHFVDCDDPIKVMVYKDKGRFYVSVEDKGVGINHYRLRKLAREKGLSGLPSKPFDLINRVVFDEQISDFQARNKNMGSGRGGYAAIRLRHMGSRVYNAETSFVLDTKIGKIVYTVNEQFPFGFVDLHRQDGLLTGTRMVIESPAYR